MGQTVRDGGVDRVFGDVALDADIVVVACLARQAPTLALHLVGRLPSPDRDLADAAHGLAVGGDDREAPISCRMSSAAMVSLRMRLSAKAMSSGIDEDR